MKKPFPYRFAIMLDGFVEKESRNKLEDVRYLETLMRDIAKRAKMAILHLSVSDVGMDVKQLGREPQPEEAGYSLLALISTSHIALHVWPHLHYFMFDLASCKAFDFDGVEAALYDALRVERVTVRERVNSEHLL